MYQRIARINPDTWSEPREGLMLVPQFEVGPGDRPSVSLRRPDVLLFMDGGLIRIFGRLLLSRRLIGWDDGLRN
jgi:hypothetical protein